MFAYGLLKPKNKTPKGGSVLDKKPHIVMHQTVCNIQKNQLFRQLLKGGKTGTVFIACRQVISALHNPATEETLIHRPNMMSRHIYLFTVGNRTQKETVRSFWSKLSGGHWAGPQPAQAPRRCTKCNSPPINGQCADRTIVV